MFPRVLTKKKLYYLSSYYFNEILYFRLKNFKFIRGPFGPRLIERHTRSNFFVYGFNPRTLEITRKFCKKFSDGFEKIYFEDSHEVSLPLLLRFKLSITRS